MDRAERVVQFLNTWEIPNRSRSPREFLQNQEDVQVFGRKVFDVNKNSDSLEETVSFRTQTREMIEAKNEELINTWLDRRKILYRIEIRGMPKIIYLPKKESVIDHVLADILTMIQEKTFHRVKICPDCKWSFFDQSKSATKKWCSMNANSPTGRACGTISKVKRFRERNKDVH